MSAKLQAEFTDFRRFLAEEIPDDSNISLEACVRRWKASRESQSNGTRTETPFERADRLSLVGAIGEGPTDLATNPQHMNGFGKS